MSGTISSALQDDADGVDVFRTSLSQALLHCVLFRMEYPDVDDKVSSASISISISISETIECSLEALNIYFEHL